MVAAEDYDELRSVSIDGVSLPADFEELERAIDQRDKEIRAAGGIPGQVYVKPAGLVAWAAREGHEINAKSRGLFAALVAGKHVDGEHGTPLKKKKRD